VFGTTKTETPKQSADQWLIAYSIGMEQGEQDAMLHTLGNLGIYSWCVTA